MTRSKDKTSSVDESLIEAIRTVVKEENKVLCDKLDKAITQLETLSAKYADIEKGLEDCSAKLERTIEVFLPELQKKVSSVTTQFAMQILQIDCHRRKWSLLIQGLKGDPNEKSAQTVTKCVDLAKNFLKIHDADAKDFAACHRLSKTADASIIVRFLNLDMRDRWLSGARELAKCPHKFPCLLTFRRELEVSARSC